jgi:hypothetical protein
MAIHQLPINSIGIVGWQTKWIQSLPLDGNQNHFGHHQIWSPPSDGNRERRNMTNPFLLVSVPHKDGRLKKIWLSSNRHNFEYGDQSFSIAKKGGHATFKKKTFR